MEPFKRRINNSLTVVQEKRKLENKPSAILRPIDASESLEVKKRKQKDRIKRY